VNEPLERLLADARFQANGRLFRVRLGLHRLSEWAAGRLWNWLSLYGAIGPDTVRGRRFGSFGQRSIIMFPQTTVFGERYIRIGSDTMIGAHVALSAGMMPGQECFSDPVVSIGDRVLIGRGSGIVGHLSIVIEDDVWTGHHVYITDQNHGYDDVTKPISVQTQPERPVRIGAGSWLGHGVVVLPGVSIGRHVAVGAQSVVTKDLPDYSVAVGNPARVIRIRDAHDEFIPTGDFLAGRSD
jgi:acetyltransferase-like isoleucine patch superfamily enzyme